MYNHNIVCVPVCLIALWCPNAFSDQPKNWEDVLNGLQDESYWFLVKWVDQGQTW